MGHAGGGGVDQPRDAVQPAGIQHVLRADHVGIVVTLVAAPGAGLGRIVEDRVHAIGGMPHRVRIGEVALHLAHAEFAQHGVVTAVEADDLVPAFDQAAAQGLAQKATTAGDEDLHACGSFCAAAHAASVSRPILALWRISTGKPGCGRNLAMRAVCG